MELVGLSALPICFLLLAVFTTQQFRTWSAHVPVTEREGGLFRHYCFGCPQRYVLCATAYFLANALFFLLLFGAAQLSGTIGEATAPWLALTLAVVVPALPGANHWRNWLRYQLQRYAFRPALPSPAEAQLWRELHAAPTPPASADHTQHDWHRLLFLCGLLQRAVENHPRRRADAELSELSGFVRQKTVALQQRGERNAQLQELLLGCCYLAIARLIVHDYHSERERRAQLGAMGLPLR